MICEICGKEHNGSYGSGRFCSKKCASSFSAKNVNHNNLKDAKCIKCGKDIKIKLNSSAKNCKCDECLLEYKLIKFPNRYSIKPVKNQNYKIIKNNNLNCNIFNDIKCSDCYFKIHNICKSKTSIKYKLNTLKKYCNLEITNYTNTLQNYLTIKYNIQKMINEGLSCVDICKLLCQSNKKGNTLFNILQIKTRNLSESVSNAIIQGKLKSKDGYHITWNNKEVYLRSSYELDYAKQLDEQKIDYEVEYFHIKYWDSQLLKFRHAIPDFYIPKDNLIVEIKSLWTFDKQNMKDKIKAYKELGYNFNLIYEHQKYFDVDEIKN